MTLLTTCYKAEAHNFFEPTHLSITGSKQHWRRLCPFVFSVLGWWHLWRCWCCALEFLCRRDWLQISPGGPLGGCQAFVSLLQCLLHQIWWMLSNPPWHWHTIQRVTLFKLWFVIAKGSIWPVPWSGEAFCWQDHRRWCLQCNNCIRWCCNMINYPLQNNWLTTLVLVICAEWCWLSKQLAYTSFSLVSSSRDYGNKVVDHQKDSSKQNEFSLNDTDTADTLSYAESIRRLHGLSSEDTKILLMGLHHGLHGTKQWQQMYVIFPETLYVDEAMDTIPETSASQHYFCDAWEENCSIIPGAYAISVPMDSWSVHSSMAWKQLMKEAESSWMMVICHSQMYCSALVDLSNHQQWVQKFVAKQQSHAVYEAFDQLRHGAAPKSEQWKN